jgi:uncharacterized protein with HEPN domain
MPLDARVFFYDIETAASEILEYTDGLTLETYLLDGRTRRAVERCLEIIGEALAQAKRQDESILANLPEYQKLIGLRNVLIHEYGRVDNTVIWQAVQEKLPSFLAAVKAEIDRIGR